MGPGPTTYRHHSEKVAVAYCSSLVNHQDYSDCRAGMALEDIQYTARGGLGPAMHRIKYGIVLDSTMLDVIDVRM